MGYMKKYVLLALVLSILVTTNTNGALLLKKNTATHHTESHTSGTAHVPRLVYASALSQRVMDATVKLPFVHKRHNLAELPKGVYIAMCILPLGWLAIAINSNFTENEWIFALLWYVLLYLPGVYYSLRQMKRFYGR
jgi:hypothetical protein